MSTTIAAMATERVERDPHYYRLSYMYADVCNDQWTFLRRNDSSNYR